jgi:threonine synthase
MYDMPYTSLLRATTLGDMLGCADIRLKVEGENPTGTHKDRAAAVLVREARREGRCGVTVGTCGNLGVAIARSCRLARLACRVVVPGGYGSARIQEMREFGAQVATVEGTYEDAVRHSRAEATTSGYYGADPIGASSEHAMYAYGGIVAEILLALGGRAPSTVWVPIGNGTTIAGIHRAVLARGCSIRLGGVSSAGNNSAMAAILAGRLTPLDPAALKATADNEPLVNWDSLQALEAAAALKACGGWGYEVSDNDLRDASRLLARTHGLCVPSYAAAGLAGFIGMCSGSLDKDATHVIVLTAGR